MKTSPPVSQFTTTRLDVAAFLLVRGFAISQVNFDGHTVTFAFADPKRSADSTATEFYNGGKVPANEYGDAQKRARDLMWQSKRASGRPKKRKSQRDERWPLAELRRNRMHAD